MPHRDRVARHARLSNWLAAQSDGNLAQRVEQAEPLDTGIGGTTLRLHVDGDPIFVKRLRLTDLERQPARRQCTANLWALPSFCQRNVGSVGVGAWREVAANELTTRWVLSRQLESLPLLFHWRVLEGAASANATPPPAELADIERQVRHWEGSAAMRARLEALAAASASVVLFLEHLPWSLPHWLEQQMAAGDDAVAAACTMVEQGLTDDMRTLNTLGLLHGDAHLFNILTDGTRLYFADLGLALSKHFELSNDERLYLRQHANLDRGYTRACWVNWLVKAWGPAASSRQECRERVRAIVQGQALSACLPGLPPSVAATIRRHAPVALAVNDFYVRLHSDSRAAAYPHDEIDALLQGADKRA